MGVIGDGTNDLHTRLQSLVTSGPQEASRVLVLGEPGSGKTTVLERLLLQLARAGAWHLGFGQPIPVLVRAHDVENGNLLESIRQAVQHSTEGRSGKILAQGIERLIEKGKVIVLFDVLDELPDASRQHVLLELRRILERQSYAPMPVVLVSQTYSDPTLQLQWRGETDVLLAWNNARVCDFLRLDGCQNIDRDFAALQGHGLLSELGVGRNPRWLKIMREAVPAGSDIGTCLHFRNQSLFFANIAQRLLGRVLASNPLAPLFGPETIESMLEVLGYLAYHMCDKSLEKLPPAQAQAELSRYLAGKALGWQPEQLLKVAKTAPLIREQGEQIEFIHPLVQQFFTTYYLYIQRSEALRRTADPRWWGTLLSVGRLIETLPTASGIPVNRRADYCQFVRNVVGDGTDTWRLFLAVGLLRNANRLYRELEHQVMTALYENLRQGVTAAHRQATIELVRILGDPILEIFGRCLKEQDPEIITATANILGDVESVTSARLLASCLANETVVNGQENTECLAADLAATMLVLVGEPAINVLLTKLQDEHSDVRWRASEALGRIGEVASQPLVAVLCDQKHSIHQRQGAALALGRMGVDNASVQEKLMSISWDNTEEVATAASIALAETGDAGRTDLVIAALPAGWNWPRERATMVLGRIKDSRAVEPLLDIVQNRQEHWALRRSAVWALGEIGDTRAVEPLMAMLRDKNWLGHDSVPLNTVPQIWNLMEGRSSSYIVKINAESARASCLSVVIIQALGQIGSPRAVKPLIEVLQDAAPLMRQRGAQALGKIKDPGAVAPLAEVLRRELYGPVREAAGCALGQIGSPAIMSLIKAMEYEQSDWNWPSQKGLVMIGSPAVLPLIAALRHESSKVRQIAVLALGDIGECRALEPLITALQKDKDTGVRRGAAWALGCMRDSQGVEPLMAALQDGGVRSMAVWALGQITDKRAVEPLIAILEDDPVCGSEAAVALGEIGDRRAVHRLYLKLDRYYGSRLDPRPGIIWAIRKLLNDEFIETLKRLMNDENILVRMEVATALGQTKSTRAVEPLIELLRNQKGVREKAAVALGQLGDYRSVEPLIAILLQDAESSVRQQAATALGHIGDTRAVKPLISALQDENPSVCSAVVEALGLIGDPEALSHLLKTERREKVLRRSIANVARKAIDQIKAASMELRVVPAPWLDIRNMIGNRPT